MADEMNPLQKAIDEHSGQQAAVPLAHYEELFAQADPELLSARSGVPFTWQEGEKAGTFDMKLLGRGVQVLWPTMETRFIDTGEVPSTKIRITIVDLLLHGQLVPGSGKFIPYTDVPWGNHYFKAFQGRCLMRLARMFKSAEAFSAACEKMGGTRNNDGDASYDFDFVGGVMIRLTIWEADDEFPPSSQILFSDNAPLAFTAEDLAVVGDITLNTLQKCVRS